MVRKTCQCCDGQGCKFCGHTGYELAADTLLRRVWLDYGRCGDIPAVTLELIEIYFSKLDGNLF